MENTYDDNVKIWKDAYTKILRACNKFPEFDIKYSFHDIRDMKYKAMNHLMLIEWYEKYGLKISHDHKPAEYNYFKYREYIVFNYYEDAMRDKNRGSGRYISWSDDDKQPKNEWLVAIQFPTGAYIFGQDYDYQKPLFVDFFKHLQTYQPDYSDTHNSSLYWKLENAKPILDDFNGILKSFQDRNKAELNKREADKLRKKLKELESKS